MSVRNVLGSGQKGVGSGISGGGGAALLDARRTGVGKVLAIEGLKNAVWVVEARRGRSCCGRKMGCAPVGCYLAYKPPAGCGTVREGSGVP